MFNDNHLGNEKERFNEAVESYGALLVRRRWWLVLPFSLISLAMMVGLLLLPDMYTSETVILVEQQRVPEQYVVSNVTSDLRDRLQTLTQQILSRTRLLRIIEEFSLYREDFDRLAPEELVEKMRSNIEIELVGGNTNRGELSAFKVAFSAESPQVAQQVTSQLTSLFIEENLKAREQQSQGTTKFLESQLEIARNELQKQETRLSNFKLRYLGELPEQQAGNLQVLAGLQMQLQNVMGSVNRSQERRVYLESLLSQYRKFREEADGTVVFEGEGQAPTLALVEDELARLRNSRAALLARYTPKHPDVIKIEEEIAQAEELKAQLARESKQALEADTTEGEKPETRSASAGDRQAISSLAQLQSQLESNRIELENLAASEERIKSQIKEYERRLNLTPVREQQLADMLRDYRLSKDNYEDLLQKKMESELATNMERRQQGEQFRVLDPPSLPEKPSSPDRLMLSVVGLLAGMGLAVGLAFVVEMKDQSVRTEKEARKALSIPLVVGIPEVTTKVEDSRRWWVRSAEWLTGTVLILLVAAGEFYMYWRG